MFVYVCVCLFFLTLNSSIQTVARTERNKPTKLPRAHPRCYQRNVRKLTRSHNSSVLIRMHKSSAGVHFARSDMRPFCAWPIGTGNTAWKVIQKKRESSSAFYFRSLNLTPSRARSCVGAIWCVPKAPLVHFHVRCTLPLETKRNLLTFTMRFGRLIVLCATRAHSCALSGCRNSDSNKSSNCTRFVEMDAGRCVQMFMLRLCGGEVWRAVWPEEFCAIALWFAMQMKQKQDIWSKMEIELVATWLLLLCSVHIS